MSDEVAQESGPPQGGPPPEPEGLPINIQGPNGERPTPEQIQQIQQQLAAEAAKQGISVQEFVQRMRQQAMAQQQAQMQAQQEAQQQQQQQPIQPGPPKPEALAVANWLKTQDLKPRTVVHDEKRKDMFRGNPSLQPNPPQDPHLTSKQSNAPFAPSTPPPTKKPALRTPSSPKSTTAPPPKTPLSCSPSRFSPCASPKSAMSTTRPATRGTTTARRSASRACGTSRSSSTRRPTMTITTSGYTRARSGK